MTEPLLGGVLKFLATTLLDDYGAVPDKAPEYGEDGLCTAGSGRREPPPLEAAAKASIIYLLGEHCGATAVSEAGRGRERPLGDAVLTATTSSYVLLFSSFPRPSSSTVHLHIYLFSSSSSSSS